ncbi:MAG TPA: YdcF family protein [Geobacteraceae bacterium]|nr:YdcF family protein [Geobacteraceae bacterium]
MSILKGIFSFLLIILIALAVLFIDFVYKTFSVSQQNVKTDAIVVLTGGRGRIEEGVRLYREHQASYLFLIGVGPSVRKSDLFKERKGEGGEEGVLLEKVSRNTLENALYAREMIEKKKDIGSVRLITSRYHMKRAMLIFRNTLPAGITIYPHPVDSRNLKEEWWSHGSSFRLLFSEFYKYCMFRFFFLVAPGELRPGKIGSI